ncbi:MAG TPA: NHL repeat-containing protein [Solirubrobacterales bacterium]
MPSTPRPRTSSHDLKEIDGRRQRSNGVLVLALALLVAVVASASAFAAGDPPDESGALLPSPSDVATAIESGESEGLPELTDRSAAEDVPLEGLQREEAVELLTGVFGESVEGAAGIYDELQEATILSPYVAVLPESESVEAEAPGEEEPDEVTGPPSEAPAELANASLLHSTIPLQVEGNEETLDLSLEHRDGTLESVAPLVRTRIPGDLNGEIEFPEIGISIEVAGLATERSASISGGSVAFYPNVAADTDLAISPTPTGVETMTQLRSADSPEVSIYRFSLPSGASLAATEAGGAKVRSGEELLLNVPAPTAIDAAGEAVPVDLEVSGDTMKVHVEPDVSAPLPILVDPLFQTYEWHAKNTNVGICSSSFGPTPPGSCNTQEEWAYKKIEKNWGGMWHLDASSGANSVQPGIHVRAQGAQEAGNYAAEIYSVPRYFKETPAPTSYIKSLKLTDVDWEALGSSASPYLFMGIWDSTDSQWINYYTQTGQSGHGVHDHAFNYEFKNPPPGNPAPDIYAKSAQISINATQSTASSSAHVWVGAATVELGDDGAPSAPMPVPQAQWVNQEAPSLGFTASDTGLGVYAVKAVTEELGQGGNPLNTWKALHGCVGVGNSACPQTWKSSEPGHQALTYQPGLLPSGINYLGLIAEDPVGNKSSTSLLEVKVDHTAPAISLSGNLTEQATAGTNLREYGLSYTAADGDEAAPSAQSPIGTTGTGSGQLKRPVGVAVDQSGNIWVVDKDNSRVLKYDKNGYFLLQFGSAGTGNGQLSDPRGIAVSQDGTVWVAELGNKRLQAFNQQGQYVRTVTYANGPAKLIEPYAVATGPEETLWLTDIGSHRIYQFRENGTFVKSIASNDLLLDAGANLSLAQPTGIAVDRFGNAWIAEYSTSYVLGLSSTGKYITRFAGPGTGNGQLSGPVGVAIARSGNILVLDSQNGRVQVFKPGGTYLRQFASTGSGNGQLSEARGIAVAAGNEALVADGGNSRIKRWSHADLDPQSGTAKAVIKVDGTTVHTKEPGCTTKNCSVSSSWTLDADDFAGGPHKVEVIATDGVGISQTKTLNIETHGDNTAPAIALSGTMIQQASIGTTRPNYKLKAVATDAGPEAELKSGVASTTIKVDGTTVDSTSPGCPAGACSITREWTLNSESYSVGSHTVEVKATDAAGRSNTKTLTIDIARDTTAPKVEYTGPLYSAPSGWLEQNKVGYGAIASDPGYGVTSVELKIDGVAVNSSTQTCAAGGCIKFFASGQTLDMANYSGGAHPAEFIARDGAGNAVKRTWTINVDPEGQISASEATDTLEAVEETTEGSPIAPNEELLEPEQIESGYNPEFQQTGSNIMSTGAPDLTTMTTNPAAGFTITSPYGETTIVPKVSEATSSTSIVEGVAGVSANASSQVDTVIRPEYNGVQIFQAIRSDASPEKYSWTVQLYAGQVLQLVDSDHAEVLYESGKRAFLISAGEAHDATGKEVPTSLEVSGNVLTLKVDFHSAAFVYPILAGAGWETSYKVPVLLEGPEDELEIKEREKAEKEAAEQEAEGPAPPPPASGYFTEAEAKKVIADRAAGEEIIPAPEPQGSGQASASSIPEKVVTPHKRCSELGCNIWWAEMKNPSYHYWRNSNGRMTSKWQNGTILYSEAWYPWYYTPELLAESCGNGFADPSQVWAGEQKHLTLWARFKITALAFTYQGDVFDFDNRLAMKIWVWPNGFQQRTVGDWEVTQEWIEHGGKCAINAL